jgi:hypothetical protein
MAHAQKPDFVFRRNGRVHLNRRGCQFSRLLATEVCASAVVMLDTPCSEVVWRVLAIHSSRQFTVHFPSLASPCAIIFQLDCTIQPNVAVSLEWCGWDWLGFVVWERDRTGFGYFGCSLPSCSPAGHFICWLPSQQDRLYVRAVTNVFWFGKTAEIPPSHPQPSLNKGHSCLTFVFIYFIAHRMQRGDDKDVSAVIKRRLI